jgi:ABC-2 type transport system ATP-binding protein
VAVAGVDVGAHPLEARRHVGYLPEQVSLYPDLTVRRYLHFVGEVKGLPGAQRRRAVGETIESCGLADVADRLAGKLSKGYRQRVGLAQALLHNPEVLILDEPTAGLDPKQIIETRELIKGLAGDHTIILSTHILPEVSQTCQRVVIINKGKVVAVDTPDNLTARLRGSETMYLQVDAQGADAAAMLQGVPGVKRVAVADTKQQVVGFEIDSDKGRDVRRQLAAAVVGRGWGLLEMRPMRMSLEEIFLHVTTEDATATTAIAPAVEVAHE